MSEELAFFPGCSLSTSARENYASLRLFCRKLGYELTEIQDWNCCGTSSAHAVNHELAFGLACRNLALMNSYQQVLVACPSCYKRLKQTLLLLRTKARARDQFEATWKMKVNTGLELVPFLSFLAKQDQRIIRANVRQTLHGLRFVPYYGCMLARAPLMKDDSSLVGIMEKTLHDLGAEAMRWGHSMKCCGTFLSVARPDLVTPLVNEIFTQARKSGTDCLVTACSLQKNGFLWMWPQTKKKWKAFWQTNSQGDRYECFDDYLHQ